MKCCFCGKELPEHGGNDPWPVNLDGECCDECNFSIVIPARIKELEKKDK